MIISVFSPVHGQAGNTTAALLISLMLAKKHNKSVCLTHLSPQSSAFYSYLGLDALEDKTCTPSQVAKLLREGAIEPHDMADYCIRVCENLDIFSNNSKSFSTEDMELTQRFILGTMPHDFIVLDIDINLELPLAKLALEKTDLAVIALTQSLNTAERYREMYKPPKKKLYICNHFSPDISSISAFAKTFAVRFSDCFTLHHSPLLMKLSNDGRLGDLLTFASDLPLPEIDADLKRLSGAIMRRFKQRTRQEVGR